MGNEKSLPDHRCNSVQAQYTQHKRHSHPSSPSHRHSTGGPTPPHHQPHHNRFVAPTADIQQRHSAATEFTSSSTTSRPLSRTDASTTKSYTSSSAYSAVTLSTHLSKTTQKRTTQATTNGRVGGIDSKQTKYLKEQLYIKSYLDIVEQDRLARNQFKAAKPGIRNYTPKILGPNPTLVKNEGDVWI